MTNRDVPNPEPSTDPEPTNDGPLSGFDAGISKRQIAVLLGIAVVVSLLIWRLRASGDDQPSQKSNAQREIEKARTEELAGEAEFEDDDENDVIEVPNNPSDELQKDAAVLEALKRNGRLQGAS